jgi:hypothetical protein
VALADDLARIAETAAPLALGGEAVEAVLAAEPASGRRLYLVAYTGNNARTWVVLDDAGVPVLERAAVREVVSLTALCELAGEAAGDDPPRLATPAYLDSLGSAALAGAFDAVEALTEDVEGAYKGVLS